jgi:hypothetical protein
MAQFRVTRCLGMEELRLHQSKYGSIYYKLNQMLLSEFLLLRNLTLKDEIYDQVCKANNRPALSILRVLLERKGKVFRSTSTDPMEQNMSQSLVENFLAKLPKIFDQFILEIGRLSPVPNCLYQHIPEIYSFQEKLGYLSPHKPVNALIDEAKIDRIFENLGKFPTLFRKCQAAKK